MRAKKTVCLISIFFLSLTTKSETSVQGELRSLYSKGVDHLHNLTNPMTNHLQRTFSTALCCARISWTTTQFLAPHIISCLNYCTYPLLGAIGISFFTKMGLSMPAALGIKLPVPSMMTILPAALLYFLWKKNDREIAHKLTQLQKSVDQGFSQNEISFEELNIKMDSNQRELQEALKKIDEEMKKLQKEHGDNHIKMLEQLAEMKKSIEDLATKVQNLATKDDIQKILDFLQNLKTGHSS